jgi:alkylhydroperoxidase/carboxymuconolactone decarboxylase family protein YurZ
MSDRNDDKVVAVTVAFIDGVFGKGAGAKHTAFLSRIDNDALREMIHRYHGLESDTRHLSLTENYLIGVAVLSATKDYGTAAMFAKTLMHLGVPRAKILEALARLAMWVGGLHAAEASLHIQKAIREYETNGLASLNPWFPPSSAEELP